MTEKISIAIAVNEKYSRYAYVMLASVISTHADRRIDVYILHSPEEYYGNMQRLKELGNENVDIHFLKIDRFIHTGCTEKWSREVNFRLALIDVLPKEVKRILYIDIDTIVINRIDEFYDMDFEGCYLRVCPDMVITSYNCFNEKQRKLFADRKEHFYYFNSGVIMMNIEKMREESMGFDFFSREMDRISEVVYAPDQDLLNHVFSLKDIQLMPDNKYDSFAYQAYNKKGFDYEKMLNETVVIHYAGFKPWEGDGCRYITEKQFWKYASMTPYYHELIEETIFREIEGCFAEKYTRKLTDTHNDLVMENISLKESNRELMEMLEKCKSLIEKMAGNC